jgi:uncharacterized membrane protein
MVIAAAESHPFESNFRKDEKTIVAVLEVGFIVNFLFFVLGSINPTVD